MNFEFKGNFIGLDIIQEEEGSSGLISHNSSRKVTPRLKEKDSDIQYEFIDLQQDDGDDGLQELMEYRK